MRVLRSAASLDVECILEPGDMLYVPARYPHWYVESISCYWLFYITFRGISLDNECMTYSVGLRLPSIENMLFAMIEHYTANFPLRETFLEEPISSYSAEDDPGRISQPSQVRIKLLKELRNLLSGKNMQRKHIRMMIENGI